MTYTAGHRNSSVFLTRGQRRRSLSTRGVPIPPGSLRRPNMSSSTNVNISNIHRASSAGNGDRHGGRPLDLMQGDDSAALTAATLEREQVAESLSQGIASQMTLTGDLERHPEQCTPAPAAMARLVVDAPHTVVAISPSQLDATQQSAAREISPPDTPPLRSLFVRDDTAGASSTDGSQLEALKYQAIVDRINNKRDQEDPTFEPPDEAGITYKPPSGFSNVKDLTPVRSSTRGDDHEYYDSTSVLGWIPQPHGTGPSGGSARETSSAGRVSTSGSTRADSSRNGASIGAKRRSPEPEITPSSKRTRNRDLRPRTYGKRYGLLLPEGQAKRADRLGQIERLWRRPLQEVIPMQLWLRGDSEGSSLPLPPEDWPSTLLEEVLKLALQTIQRSGKAIAALRRALAQQVALFGGPLWIKSVSDVTFAIQIVLDDDETETLSDGESSVGQKNDGPPTRFSATSGLCSTASGDRERSCNTPSRSTPDNHDDQTGSTRSQDEREQEVVLETPPSEYQEPISRPASPSPTVKLPVSTPEVPPADNHQHLSGRTDPLRKNALPLSRTPIKSESSFASLTPSVTSPALLATIATPNIISRLTEDETYTLKLLVEDEVQRRKVGGKPVPGNVSTSNLRSLTAYDLSHFSALDFHRLRKLVDADWERRETVGRSMENAMVID